MNRGLKPFTLCSSGNCTVLVAGVSPMNRGLKQAGRTLLIA